MKRVLMILLIVAACVTTVAAEPQKPADQWLTKPVDEKTFQGYLDFFAYERQAPFATRVTKTVNDQGLRREYLSFESTRGERVTATLTEQAGGPAGKKPAIILLHGGVAKGKDGPIRFIDLFARAGWTVLAIDMPYFGERASGLLTTYSEQEKHEKLYNEPSTYLSWITQVTKDSRRAFDLLINERGADPKRIALVGISRGAIVAAIAGAVEKRFSGVALIYGGHFDALETGHLPAACPANYIGRIAPRPLFMINGTQDSDMIRDRSVEPLFKVARQPKQIIWTDGGHMFMNEEQRAAIIQWLRHATR